MSTLYSLSIYIYTLLIKIASLKSDKAKMWIEGRADFPQSLKQRIKTDKPVIWIHCASLGEFEQARPLIEKLKIQNKSFILLSFFSPSGFEMRKNYSHADHICYLPADTRSNAKQFIEIVKPEIAIFIKYEFWFNYLRELKSNQIKTYLVSGIFRPKQHFFKFYGKWFRKQLNAFTYFFLQNKESEELLNSISYTNSIVTGDTRFDQVYSLTQEEFNNEAITSFCKDEQVIIAGSSWEKEHEFIVKLVHEGETKSKFIIAPHEIKPNKILTLKKKLSNSCVLLSEIDQGSDISQFQILIIDQIGMLSKLYRYAYLSIIGGGFGAGIHNTLEAATYGSPIIFGPNYHKFQEAKDLIELGTAHSFSNFIEFKELITFYTRDLDSRKTASLKSLDYVKSQLGSTEKILNVINC